MFFFWVADILELGPLNDVVVKSFHTGHIEAGPDITRVLTAQAFCSRLRANEGRHPVDLILRGYTDPPYEGLSPRDQTLLHRAILLNSLDDAMIRVFSPTLVSLESGSGKHRGLVQIDRSEGGKNVPYELVAPPIGPHFLKVQRPGSEQELITVDSTTYQIAAELYHKMSQLFRTDIEARRRPEQSIWLYRTPNGFRVGLLNLGMLELQEDVKPVAFYLNREVKVPSVTYNFGIDQLFRDKDRECAHDALMMVRTLGYAGKRYDSPLLSVFLQHKFGMDRQGVHSILSILVDNCHLSVHIDGNQRYFSAAPNPYVVGLINGGLKDTNRNRCI